MKKISLALLAIAATTLLTACQKENHSKDGFTAAQLKQIQQVSADYIIAHPEVLVKASQNLQKQQMKKLQEKTVIGVLANQQAILRDPVTPKLVPKDAKVAVVEFFDLNCAYCHKIAPAIKDLMQKNPNVAFIFHEFPIFASRWSSSKYGAEMGLALFKVGGFTAFNAYHNGIMLSDKMEGKLTVNDVNTIAMKAAKDNKVNFAKVKALAPSFESHLESNMQLGGAEIGFQGTPGVIVMPLTDATKDNVTVFPGYTSEQAMQAAIDKLK